MLRYVYTIPSDILSTALTQFSAVNNVFRSVCGYYKRGHMNKELANRDHSQSWQTLTTHDVD